MKADLNKMNVPELKALAKQAGIDGSDSMKKAELIAALEKPIESARASKSESNSEIGAAKSERSSDQDLDYASHPKFHKFKGKAKGAE